MKVWKYDVSHALNRQASILMPWTAKPIFGGIQDGNLVLWVEVSDDGSYARGRNVIVAFTGFKFNQNGMTHLNSFTDAAGLVYHVYTETD